MRYQLAVTLLVATFSSTQAWSIPIHHGDHGGPRSYSLVVETSAGTMYGKIDPAIPNVRQFLGIPYAQPPTGPLRFEPPQVLPVSARKNQIQATELPPSCPQYLTDLGNSLYVRDVLQFNLQGLNTTGAISEDCLTLAVWAPNCEEEKRQALPVLIFFYGGGFSTGGINVPYQLPPQWVERTQDHIVVSFNYRVNLFGFPNAAGLKTQNLGLLDQRLAVEWVHSNIAGFGGDPSRIVIWGQSAGAGSVDYYNYAYYSDPIVKGLIMDSGTALLPSLSSDFAGSNFSFVASNVGCGHLSASDQVACMKKIPFATLENFFARYQESGATPAISFGPLPDNRSVFANYTERALAGLTADIPAIVGTNAQDGEAFAPYVPSGPNQTIAQIELLTTFFCPATETVRLRHATDRTTFRYLYAGNWTNIAPRDWEGAYHSSELPMLMGTFDNYRGRGPALENETSVAMQDAWVAFASGGANALEATGWGNYAVGENTVREFGKGVAAQNTNVRATEAMCVGAQPALPL